MLSVLVVLVARALVRLLVVIQPLMVVLLPLLVVVSRPRLQVLQVVLIQGQV